MSVPPHFEEARIDEIHHIIVAHPLATLVYNGLDGLDANLLPFELDVSTAELGFLRAHVARANPLWVEARDGDDVLIVFRAADAYISPNWYPSKHEFHRQVPTWNYQVANVHGRIRIRDDERYVRGVVARLTRVHEARTEPANPWTMGDSPTDFIDGMLQAIVGIEVELSRIVCKSKLGQNREARDRVSVADELQRRNQTVLSEAMRNL